MKTQVFVCPICGNVIAKLVDSGVVPECCGQPMEYLRPKMQEAEGDLREKHLPDISLVDDSTLRVAIGSVLHPMSKEHLISIIMLESENGLQMRFLSPDNKPTAKFYCGWDKPTGVYAFCNKHGLYGCKHLPPTVRHSSCKTPAK